MREFTRFHAEHSINVHIGSWTASEAVGHPIQFIEHLAHNLRSRHVLRDIARRNDHLLEDMGVSRSEIEDLAHAGLSHDALEELEIVRQQHSNE